MTNFLIQVANSLDIEDSLLTDDYFQLIQNKLDFKTLYNARGPKYITTLLYLIRVPFRFEVNNHSYYLEGLKKLYYKLILQLYDLDQNLTINILENTIYWKDLLNIWVEVNKLQLNKKDRFAKYDLLIRSIRKIINDQRSIDLKKVKEGDSNISLLGKYCVSENSYFDKNAYWFNITENGLKKDLHVSFMIRDRLYIASVSQRKPYPVSKTVPFKTKKIWRKDNTLLRENIGILETKLCSKDYESLEDIFIPIQSYTNNYKVLNQHNIKKKICKTSKMFNKVIYCINNVVTSYSE